MQNQPMMRTLLPFFRDPAHQFTFHMVRRLSRCHSGAVSNAENVRVNSNRWMAKGLIEHNICCFPADPRERLEGRSVLWHGAIMLGNENFR